MSLQEKFTSKQLTIIIIAIINITTVSCLMLVMSSTMIKHRKSTKKLQYLPMPGYFNGMGN